MWIALFSQTGTEIVEVATRLGCWPDYIFTNNKDRFSYNSELIHNTAVKIAPHEEIIKSITSLSSTHRIDLITLHGYLRIMPDLPYKMYNGHPGDIVKYPELKGKDPQRKALDLKLPSTGCVIHEVTPELDGGPIVMREQYIMQGDEDELILINRLRKISINMWYSLIKEKMNVW